MPGSGRSLGERNGNSLQYSCWEIRWTEEPVRRQSMGFQRVGHNLVTQQQKEAVMEPSNLQPASQKHKWPLVIGGRSQWWVWRGRLVGLSPEAVGSDAVSR